MKSTPAVGALVVDTERDQLGEYRGEWAGEWSLRPVGGGKEWTTKPANVEPATTEQRLSAGTALANARSRGERL